MKKEKNQSISIISSKEQFLRDSFVNYSFTSPYVASVILSHPSPPSKPTYYFTLSSVLFATPCKIYSFGYILSASLLSSILICKELDSSFFLLFKYLFILLIKPLNPLAEMVRFVQAFNSVYLKYYDCNNAFIYCSDVPNKTAYCVYFCQRANVFIFCTVFLIAYFNTHLIDCSFHLIDCSFHFI